MPGFTKRTWGAIISLIVLTCTVSSAAATEKYWIAHEAEMIVVGTLQPGRGF